MSFSSVRQNALALPVQDRAALLEELWESINQEINKDNHADIAKKWADESESRIDAVDQGKLSTIDGPTALAAFRQMLKE